MLSPPLSGLLGDSIQSRLTPRLGFEAAVALATSQGVQVPLLPEKFNPSSDASPLLNQSKEFSQSVFSLQAGLALKKEIMPCFSLARQVLVTGRSCKGANYWLTTPPSVFTQTVLDRPTFRLLLKFHLGLPLMADVHLCPDCLSTQDVFGHHALSCKKSSGFIDKHNAIVTTIFDTLKSAGVSCSKEAFNPMTDDRQRPGDIHIPDFDVYGEAYLDVSIINILAPSHLSRAASAPLAGSQIRFDEKIRKYQALGANFKPLILECTGGWHRFSMDYLKIIANRISSCSLKSPTKVLNNNLTAVSFRLQRHQGSKLIRRCLGC